MSVVSPVGGGNRLTLHTHTAGAVNAAFATLNHIISSTITGHPKKNSLVISCDMRDFGEGFATKVLEPYLSAVDTTVTLNEYEDGTKDTISSASNLSSTFIGIWYNGAETTNRQIIIGEFYLSGATGDFSTTKGDTQSGTFEITARDAAVIYTIPDTVFDASLVTGATKTLATGAYGTNVYLPKA